MNSQSSSQNSNAAYVSVSVHNRGEGTSVAYTADDSDVYLDIKTNAPAGAYAYVDCTSLDETNMLDKSADDNEKKGKEIQGGPGDGSLHFHLEKDDNKESEIGVNGSQDYDRQVSAAHLASYHQNGDEDAYQHIQPQTTPAGNDQDYQHLKRDKFC